jgi:hypothetical protein
MAQVTRTTSTPLGYNPSALSASITALRSQIAAGQQITASAFNNFASLYNSWIAHYHSTVDYIFVGFGLYGGITQTVTNSAAVSSRVPTALTKITGNNITAADVNALITAINSIRAHTHSIVDVIS